MEKLSLKEKEKLLTIEEKFGMAIRYFRQLADLSQEELAFNSGLHRNYVSDTERGKRNVSLEAIEKFAKGLDINITDIFDRVEQNHQ